MTDWSKVKVKDLKDELEKRGIDSSGLKKSELVERLEELDGGSKSGEAASKKDSAAPDASNAPEVPEDDMKEKNDNNDNSEEEDPQDHASPRELRDDDVDEENDGSNKRQRTTEDGQGKQLRKLCRTLLVSGYKEPVNEADLRTLMEKHGSVDKIWVSEKKNEALVFFKRAEGATTAKTALHDVEWPEGSGGSLRLVYRNIYVAINHARRFGDAEFSVELTEEDPKEDRKINKDTPNPFRQTTTEPVIYWKTVRAYP